MGLCKHEVTLVCKHWRYFYLTLNHWYQYKNHTTILHKVNSYTDKISMLNHDPDI